MDIGIIQPELIYLRGAEKQVCKLAHFLNEWGHNVTIYTFEKEKNYAFDPLLQNIDIISLNQKWINPSLSFLNHFRWYYLINKLSTKIKELDVINVHNHPAQWISKFTDIPVVWMCNEPYRDKISNQGLGRLYPANLIDSHLTSDLNLILTISPEMKQIIKNRYPGKIVKIVGSGVDLEREIKHVDNAYFDSIFVGPIHPQKRPLDIVKAFSLVKEIKDIRLHFVGNVLSDSLKKEMNEIAFNNNLEIIFYGAVSNEKLYELYDIADIAIFVPESEPWGIFPLETTLAGIPTIISDQCGVTHLLEDHSIVKTGDIERISKKILEVYIDYDQYLKRMQKIRKIISKNYSWDSYSKKIENYLKIF
jgi:glycosyltransferase involved in cell wall biosynthesis